MTGIFDPVVWADGDTTDSIPTADDLNEEWKESLDFLLGNTRPIAFLYSTTGTSLSTTSEFNVPFNNEKLLRGSMGHSTVTNNHQLTLPVTGQYAGWAWGGFQTMSTLATRLIVRVKNNGTNIAYMSMKPEFAGGWNIHGSVTINAVGGDVISMTMQTTAGTAVMGNTLLAAPRLCLYYVGAFS